MRHDHKVATFGWVQIQEGTYKLDLMFMTSVD